MSDAGVGYRTAAARCELCDVEVEAATLEELAGLRCCQGCRGGDLERAIKRWDFVLRRKHTAPGHRTSESFMIEVQRPTFMEAFAKFDRDSGPKQGWFSRLFARGDPEVGDKAFDDQVLIAPDTGADEATMRLLSRPGVRQAVMALVQQGCEVDLTGKSVWAHDRDNGLIDPIGEMGTAEPLLVALAVHVERYARESG
jgi:hypothetical protein